MTKDLIVLQKDSSGKWQEVILPATPDYVLGFDATGSLTVIPQTSNSQGNIDGGNSLGQ